jgi:hypothetical protein
MDAWCTPQRGSLSTFGSYTTHQRKRAFVAALDAGWPPS